MKRYLVGFVVVGATILFGCTTGDGEGPRYTAPVVSVSDQQLCVGPNQSSSEKTCGAIPAGFTDLPRLGQCVSLFAKLHDQGQGKTWTTTSLRLSVEPAECQGR